MAYIMKGELYHHGIKGQKWGVRRYQNEDGTLTALGRARKRREIGNDPDVVKKKKAFEKAKENYNQVYKAYNTATANGLLPNDEAVRNLTIASNNLTFAREDLKDEMSRKKMEIDNRPKSQTREKYEKLYESKGMTQKEAELAAYKREKTEKALKIVAGVTAATAIVYGGTKYADYNFDKVIKTDVLLNRVTTSDTSSVQDAFYAVFAKNKKDVSKYTGLYANQIHFEGKYGHKKGTDVYEKTIRAVTDMKLASPKNAMKSLQKLVDDDINYKMELAKVLTKHGDYKQAEKLINTGKVSKDVYERMNVALGSSMKNTELAKKYYSELSSKGYNAIKDMNDSKYSGFFTKMPIIVFDAKSKVSVDKVTKLSENEIKAQNARAWADIGKKVVTKQLGRNATVWGLEIGVAGAGIGALKISQHKKEEKVVSEYRKKHPNSKLTYKQIVRNYYSS